MQGVNLAFFHGLIASVHDLDQVVDFAQSGSDGEKDFIKKAKELIPDDFPGGSTIANTDYWKEGRKLTYYQLA